MINASAPPSLERPLLVAVEQTRGTVDQLTAYFILDASSPIAAPALSSFPYSMAVRSTIFTLPMLSGKCCPRMSIRTSPVRPKSVKSPARTTGQSEPQRGHLLKGYLAELRGRGVDLHLMREEVPPQGSRPRIVHLLVSLRNHMRSLGRCAQPAD